jgi:hypothetical protein
MHNSQTILVLRQLRSGRANSGSLYSFGPLCIIAGRYYRGIPLRPSAGDRDLNFLWMKP